jgi:hypothetical protein
MTILFVGFFTMGFSPKAFKNVKNENPIEVKFLSKVRDMPVFQLNINNEETGAFFIKVKDGFGNVLLKETLTGKKVWRKYLLEIEASDFHNADFQLVFEVTHVTTNKTSVYNVTRNTRMVEDISIAKL